MLTTDECIDYLIRWGLHDLVAGAEPSPQVWRRVERRVLSDPSANVSRTPVWRTMLLQHLPSLILPLCCLFGVTQDNRQYAYAKSMHTRAAEMGVLSGWNLRFC